MKRKESKNLILCGFHGSFVRQSSTLKVGGVPIISMVEKAKRDRDAELKSAVCAVLSKGWHSLSI